MLNTFIVSCSRSRERSVFKKLSRHPHCSARRTDLIWVSFSKAKAKRRRRFRFEKNEAILSSLCLVKDTGVHEIDYVGVKYCRSLQAAILYEELSQSRQIPVLLNIGGL